MVGLETEQGKVLNLCGVVQRCERAIEGRGEEIAMSRKIISSILCLSLVHAGCFATASRKMQSRFELIREETLATREEARGIELEIKQKPTASHPRVGSQVTAPIAEVETKQKVFQRVEQHKRARVAANLRCHIFPWTFGLVVLAPLWYYPASYSELREEAELHLEKPPGTYKISASLFSGGDSVRVSTREIKGEISRNQPEEVVSSWTQKKVLVHGARVVAQVSGMDQTAEARSDPSGKCIIPITGVVDAFLKAAAYPSGATIHLEATHESGQDSKELELSEREVVEIAWRGEIDWSAGEVALAPYPRAECKILPADRPIRAGDLVTLSVTVLNEGRGGLHQVYGTTACKEVPIDKKLILFGRIAPGESVTRELVVRIPKEWEDERAVPVRISFNECRDNVPAEIETVVSISRLPKPAFAYSLQVIDDGSGNSVGNGDGRIQKGEAVDLLVTVKNVGEEVAKDATLVISTAVREGIELYADSARFGDIRKGSTKSARLNVGIKRTAKVNALPLDLEVREVGFGVKLLDQTTLPLDTVVAPRVIVLAKKVRVQAEESAIRGGAGDDTPMLARTQAGVALDVVGQLGEWYKVQLPEGEFGWIAASSVTESMETLPEQPATAEAGPAVIKVFRKQPPQIALFEPDKDVLETTEDSVKLRGLVIDDQAVKEVRALVDGELIEVGSGRRVEVVPVSATGATAESRAQVRFEYLVPVKQGRNEVRIEASDNEGLSAVKTLTITRVEEKGEVYVLVIGITEYEDANIRRLPYAEFDAEAVYGFYTDSPRSLARAENVSLLLGERADARGIRRALSNLARKAKETDTIICYYAGHGDIGTHPRKGTEYYMIPQDAAKDDLFGTAIELSDLQRLWSAVVSKRKVFIVDCCNAGGFTELRGEVQEGFERGLGEGTVVMAASTRGQKALELAQEEHGLFTYFFLQGLQGAADEDGNDKIGVSEMKKYVEDKVSNKAREMGGVQNPVTKIEATGEVYLTR